MAIPYSTGPVHIWPILPVPTLSILAGSGTKSLALANLTKAPVYLGTSERGPDEIYRYHKAPLHNDLAGPVLPFDMIEAGSEVFLAFRLTCWNEVVYNIMACSPRPTPLGPGIQTLGDRGSLMITEGRAFPVILRYPFYDKPVYRANNMPAGVRLFAGWMEGEQKHETGTQANGKHILLHFMSIYDQFTGNFNLFDYSIGNVPAHPPAT